MRRKNGTTSVRMVGYFPPGVAIDARVRAAERGISISDYMAEAVREHLDREDAEGSRG